MRSRHNGKLESGKFHDFAQCRVGKRDKCPYPVERINAIDSFKQRNATTTSGQPRDNPRRPPIPASHRQHAALANTERNAYVRTARCDRANRH